MREKLVIYRLGSLGDTVIALPMFHAVARAFPQYERIVLTNVPIASNAAPLMSVLGGSGLVHDVVRYPVGTRSMAELLDLRSRLKNLGASTLIYLAAPRGLLSLYRDLLFFRSCGFSSIIGAPSTTSLQKNLLEPDGSEEPEYLRLSRCLLELGPFDFSDPACWDMRLNYEEWSKGRAATASFDGRPFISINMGGKAREKDWGAQNWHVLLGALAAEYPGAGLLIVGAAEDAERGRELSSSWRGPVAFACGTLTPRECGAALSGSTFFIGHDSGPLHLASVMGVRCIGLFGDFNAPRKWHPASPRTHIIHEMLGVSAISIETVLAAVRKTLAAGHDIR